MPRKKHIKNRAIPVSQLQNMRFDEFEELPPEWAAHLGDLPECTGVWFIYGDKGNGKTNYSMMLAKQTSREKKTAYNSLEEGTRKSFALAVKRHSMGQIKRNMFLPLNKEPLDELIERLRSKSRPPKVVFIDSLQMSLLNKRTYVALKNEFAHKVLFIFLSHEQNGKPKGDFAEFVAYDADIVIRVKWFKALVEKTRYENGGAPIVIYEKKAKEKWAEIE